MPDLYRASELTDEARWYGPAILPCKEPKIFPPARPGEVNFWILHLEVLWRYSEKPIMTVAIILVGPWPS